ncbi:unnamed protein product, partial [Symbiodinium sp. CCMP2456]
MPPSASWSKQLQEAGMPEEAANVVALAYASDQLFYHAFRNEDRLDSYAKSVLVKTKAISQDDTEWDIHPTVAALRATWRSLKSTISASVPPPAAERAATDCTALMPFLQASSRMSSGDRAKLVEKYENDYPGVGVCPMVLPSLQYLQRIKSQCSSQSWEWTPWRKIISEDELEDVSASPFKVEKLLSVRGHKADDAVHTVVKERDVLRRLLFCPSKAPKESKGAGKGK